MLQEHDKNRCVESTDGGLLIVISDFTCEDEILAGWQLRQQREQLGRSRRLYARLRLASGGVTLALLFWRRLL